MRRTSPNQTAATAVASAFDDRDGQQGGRVDDLQVLESGPWFGGDPRGPQRDQTRGVVIAAGDGVGDHLQRLRHAHRGLPIVGAEPVVAARDRQAVGLAHGRHLDDLDVHVEVGRPSGG